jgi:hypothetical protein
MDEIAGLKAELSALRVRVQAAEDYRELVNLQGAYGYYVDKGCGTRRRTCSRPTARSRSPGAGSTPDASGCAPTCGTFPLTATARSTTTCSSSRCCTSTARRALPAAAGAR